MSPLADSTLGLRVLDISQSVAGAYCTKLFAGYGADVVVLESPQGHPLRRYGPFPKANADPGRRPPVGAETGALWLYLAANKKSITLDISQPSGGQLLRQLVEEAEIIVESFSPGYLDTFGLGYQEMRRIKRRIVLLSLTPYGQTGPYAGRPATDLTLAAAGGHLCLTGQPQREPLKLAGYQAEYLAGLHAFFAAAAAAHQADAFDTPQHIDVSVRECLVSILGQYLPIRAYLGQDAKRQNNASGHASTLQDLLDSPQLKARHYFRSVQHPKAGPLTYPGPPFSLSEMEWQAGRAPLLGEHNREIYGRQLSLSPQELQRLKAAKVI